MENGTNTGKFPSALLVFYAAEINFALLFWSIDLPFRYTFVLL